MVWPLAKSSPSLRGKIDFPTARSVHCREHILVSGWALGEQGLPPRKVGVFVGDSCIAETKTLLLRPDVTASFKLPQNTRTGFKLLCSIFDDQICPVSKSSLSLSVRAAFGNDPTWEVVDNVKVALKPVPFSDRPYGTIIYPTFTHEIHREQIYSTGRPSPSASQECVDLITGYIDSSMSVLDVGCGIGAYGKELIAKGYNWFGVEVFDSLCEELERSNLPHAKVDDKGLPFADGAFDTAICIEVLEHIPNVDQFLKEIARAVRHRAVFSVPNIEPIPMLAPIHSVPWHLLEGDHKNFFTRFNLKHLLSKYFANVEVIAYGELPIRTPEGQRVYNHLFAIADKE